MSLRPLHDRVLIRRVGQEEKTRGGILIPDWLYLYVSAGLLYIGLGAVTLFVGIAVYFVWTRPFAK